MVAVPALVAVNVRLVLPGLMTTMPLVLVALLMVNASPLGLRSFVSGERMTGTKLSAEPVSSTAVGDGRSKKLLLVAVLALTTSAIWLSLGACESPVL